MINIEYCPCGSSELIEVENLILYNRYFYCPKCNKIYQKSIVELSKEEVNKNFYADRYSELIEYAKKKNAMKKVTFEDLKKLCEAIKDVNDFDSMLNISKVEDSEMEYYKKLNCELRFFIELVCMDTKKSTEEIEKIKLVFVVCLLVKKVLRVKKVENGRQNLKLEFTEYHQKKRVK
jgi:hypothetical protein